MSVMWRPDPAIDAARKLPDWGRFHRVCGQHDVVFDEFERVGRVYRCAGYLRTGRQHVETARCEGASVVDALANTFHAMQVTIPEAQLMLDHGLNGVLKTIDYNDLF